MKLYLSLQRNGLYALTHKPPLYTEVGKSGELDVYVPYGDAVGMRNICPWFCKAVLKIEELPPFGTCILIWLEGKELKDRNAS